MSVENECLKRDCHIYLEALILSKHKIFGKTSEHTEDEGQQTFFNEAEVEYTEKTEEPVSKMVKGYTRKSPKTKRDELIRNIETEVITCTIPDEEQICPRCGSQMKVTGKKYVREEVELIPAKLVVKKYYSNTYSCKKCEKKNMPVFLHGFVPAPVLPHSLASASTVSWVVYQKYVNANVMMKKRNAAAIIINKEKENQNFNSSGFYLLFLTLYILRSALSKTSKKDLSLFSSYTAMPAANNLLFNNLAMSCLRFS